MQYDMPISQGELNAVLGDSLSNETLAAIEAILGNQGSGDEVVVGRLDLDAGYQGPSGRAPDVVLVDLANRAAGENVNVTIPDNILQSAKVYSFNTDANISVGFNTVERVIAMGNGNDFVTVGGDKNTTVDGGMGNDTIITSGGNDFIIGGAGNDSISTGAGNDTIVSGEGRDTVDGGTGYDVIVAAGDVDTWQIDVVDGFIVLVSKTDATNAIVAKNVEFIQLGNTAVSVVATEEEATALRLYQALLGRTADREGAEYWVNDVNKDGGSTHEVAGSFLASDEFIARGEMSNETFVSMLYEHALGREADAGGLAYWVNDIDSGAYNRAEVAIAIVGSTEAAETIVTVQILDGLV